MLQWVAAGLIVRGPTIRSKCLRWHQLAGRTYNTDVCSCVPSGVQASTTARISTPGDVYVRPLVRVYGPISAPKIATQVVDDAGSPIAQQVGMTFKSSARVDAGHWVDIDHDKHTILLDSDPLQSMFSSVDWGRSTWLAIPPAPAFANITLSGTATSTSTQCVAFWRDGYIS